MTADTYCVLARYNEWINSALYGVCSGIADAERKHNRGAFFGSVHGTLNHILLADRVWMGRFENQPYAVPSLATELYADFDELRTARVAEDQRIVAWAATLDPAALTRVFSYTSMVNPQPRSYIFGHVISHFFNHQTHHRGQLTTLLAQMGIDYGVTDIIGMPGVQLDGGA
jgi:uncharacterized damage-inducible protein DinB